MLHIHPADHYHSGSSRLHRLDPRAKVVAAFAFVLAAAVLPDGSWFSLTLMGVALVAVAHSARLGWAYALRRAFVVLPFALAAITLPFTLRGQPLAEWGGVVISLEGTVRFLSILFKSWVSAQAALLLTALTPFHDLLWAMRALHVPRPLVSIVSFMYRYLFVLGDEALRLMRAQSARAASGEGQSGGSWLWRGRVAGGMVGNLTLRAFERSERIYEAMVARGFQGDIKTIAPPRLTAAEANVLVAWATFLAMCLLIGYVL